MSIQYLIGISTYPMKIFNNATTKEKGDTEETRAVKYLKKKGYKIIERNFRKKFGEIDIICKKDKTLVFVEVRSLKGGEIDPIQTVSRKKMDRIITTVKYYIQSKDIHTPVRIDFIGIKGENITHVEDAYWEGL